ncbi:MAG: alpha/beta hydrolase-fold protein [Bacteroidales bacterium]|jgi:predicted alpha/beta superfamily hydrolase
MKKIAGLIGLILLVVAWPVQSQVTFVLETIPSYTPEAGPVYIAGDFNGWNPGNPAQALQKNSSGKWWITLPARNAGTVMQYKFTRGSWATVEKGAGGEEIANRTYSFSIPDTVPITIQNWADNNGVTTTAAKNVSKISENFFMPQLNRTRRIWLYLPPDYETSGKSYPVLYMHDGQNVFDSYTAYAGEWNVDESLNELANEGHEVPIVVAIDNGSSHRMDEYSPWPNNQYGGGEGDQYIDFIVNTLKHYIDSAYRTRKDRASTGIMGSSMGGLISMYGAFKRPDIFGKAGIFSPSYWFSSDIWAFIRNTEKVHPMRAYQIVGSSEGGSMPSDMLAMQDTLRKYGYGDNELKSKVVAGAQHNELFWRSEFKEAFLWLFSESSGIGSIPKPGPYLKLFPNPTQNALYLNVEGFTESVHLRIYNIMGTILTDLEHFSGNRVETGSLPSGKYLIKISGKEGEVTGWFVKE